MESPNDQPVAEEGGSSSNPQSLSSTDRVPTATERLSMAHSITSKTSASPSFRTATPPTTATPEMSIQQASSSNHRAHISTAGFSPAATVLPTVKRDLSSDEAEDVKPPQGKKPRTWHPPLLAPSSDCSNRDCHRSTIPSPSRQLRSRSPRARAIYEDYRPGLRLASVLGQNTSADYWYETHIQATRNVHISRIESLRAREDVEEAIWEYDQFQLEIARENLQEEY